MVGVHKRFPDIQKHESPYTKVPLGPPCNCGPAAAAPAALCGLLVSLLAVGVAGVQRDRIRGRVDVSARARCVDMCDRLVLRPVLRICVSQESQCGMHTKGSLYQKMQRGQGVMAAFTPIVKRASQRISIHHGTSALPDTLRSK